MNEIIIKEGNQEYRFSIDKYKFIICNDMDNAFMYKRLCLKFIRQVNDSEYYRETNCIERSLLIDHKEFNKKTDIFTIIQPDLNISEELKISPKSIIWKYFEQQFENPIYQDTIQTLQILFDSLEQEINSCSKIKIKFQDITIKNLLKLSSAYIEKNHMICNEYDLNYEETIHIQLEMLKIIEKDPLLENILVFMDVPNISNEIINDLSSFNKCKFIILSTNFSSNINIENFYFIGNTKVDFANDEQIFLELCEKSTNAYNLLEVKNMLKNYIYDKEQCADDILRLLR